MSKKDLRLYLHKLDKEQLEEQIIDLYTRFKEVKEYYDFAFNPKENKLMEECKLKISKEYYPVSGRKAKMRRSVAQKYIRHFNRLGVEPSLVADIMFYHIEIAQTYSSEQYINQEAFFKAMLKAFSEALQYVNEHGIRKEFNERIQQVILMANEQRWMNRQGFERVLNGAI
jgi:transcriptional regulator with PAS, ATPase and Fis domain